MSRGPQKQFFLDINHIFSNLLGYDHPFAKHTLSLSVVGWV